MEINRNPSNPILVISNLSLQIAVSVSEKQSNDNNIYLDSAEKLVRLNKFKGNRILKIFRFSNP